MGFEPTEPVKVQQFSRLPDSTALAPLREPLILIFGIEKYQVGYLRFLISVFRGQNAFSSASKGIISFRVFYQWANRIFIHETNQKRNTN